MLLKSLGYWTRVADFALNLVRDQNECSLAIFSTVLNDYLVTFVSIALDN